MPALPTLRRITSLKDLGVFRNSTVGDAPEFRRWNLIYGFNGCGKTTLSRVFASLERGSISPDLPSGGSFEIELTDGTKLSSGGSLASLMGRVMVFNEDFVEANLRWKEGTSNPIFLVGAQQIADAQSAESKQRELNQIDSRLTESKKGASRAEAALAEHKRSTARLIADQLGLGRRYEAPNVVADYGSGAFASAQVRSEEALASLRETIAERQPLPKVAPVRELSFDLGSLIDDVRRALQSNLGSLEISELYAHAEMLEWVKRGHDYHRDHDLDSCLFCGSPLTKERMGLLSVALGERIERILRETRSTFESVQNAQRECISLGGLFDRKTISLPHSVRRTTYAPSHFEGY
jgi:wobble nucleotide-excising tRNase